MRGKFLGFWRLNGSRVSPPIGGMDVSTRSRGALVVALLLAAGPAHAQIGEGWVEYDPGSTIQLDGSGGIETSPGSTGSVRNEGASFARAGSIETFVLFDPTPHPGEPAAPNPARVASVGCAAGGRPGAAAPLVLALLAGLLLRRRPQL